MKPILIVALLLGIPLSGVIDAQAKSLEEIQPVTIHHGPSTNNSARIELLKKEGDDWLPKFPEVVRKQFDTTDWLYWVDFGIRLPKQGQWLMRIDYRLIGGADKSGMMRAVLKTGKIHVPPRGVTGLFWGTDDGLLILGKPTSEAAMYEWEPDSSYHFHAPLSVDPELIERIERVEFVFTTEKYAP